MNKIWLCSVNFKKQLKSQHLFSKIFFFIIFSFNNFFTINFIVYNLTQTMFKILLNNLIFHLLILIIDFYVWFIFKYINFFNLFWNSNVFSMLNLKQNFYYKFYKNTNCLFCWIIFFLYNTTLNNHCIIFDCCWIFLFIYIYNNISQLFQNYIYIYI